MRNHHARGGLGVLIENEDGVADLYGTATLHPMAHFTFPSRICEASFTADGSLMVLNRRSVGLPGEP
jgi:hypothetical protein